MRGAVRPEREIIGDVSHGKTQPEKDPCEQHQRFPVKKDSETL